MSELEYFVGIDSVGRAENLKGDWYSILDNCHARLMSGDRGRPKTLMRNGDVVTTKLDDLGYDYGKKMREAVDRSIQEVRDQFKPPWKMEQA